jgi:hypothetical protein
MLWCRVLKEKLTSSIHKSRGWSDLTLWETLLVTKSYAMFSSKNKLLQQMTATGHTSFVFACSVRT